MYRILAAVVTYNRKKLLMECIDSLFKQDYQSFDILIVDNASTDGTGDELANLLNAGKISYYNTGSNIGGAGGFNTAMRLAVEKEYDYVWIMDDDTIPYENALGEMVSFMQGLNDKWGFISGNALWIDGCRSRMNEQKFYGNGGCKQASFVSMMIPTDIIRDVGLPIKEFFIWGDDVEYSRRISRKYPCYYLENSKVLHKTENNAGSDISRDQSDRLERYRYAYRNEVYIAKKEGGTRILYQLCKIFLHLFRITVFSKGNRLKKYGLIISASIEGVRFSPPIEYI